MSRDNEPPERGGLIARTIARGNALANEAREWLARRRAISVPVDVIVGIYERDRENFGSVLGSAIAFRLFLFMLSLATLAVGMGTLLVGAGWFGEGLSDEIGITGALAAEVDQAAASSETTALILTFIGLTGTLWAGKNLAVTQIAASARAWRIPRSASRTTVRAIGAVIAVAVVLSATSLLVNAVRDGSGPAVVTTSFVAVFVASGTVWLVFTLTLPRATRDPTVLLPGAVLVGATFTALQWLSQFYLAPRLESQAELLGGFGITAVVLGWLFIGSRIMVASFAVNAVLFEQVGSALRLFFELPGLRRLPGRYPSLARLLERDVGTNVEGDDAGLDSAWRPK